MRNIYKSVPRDEVIGCAFLAIIFPLLLLAVLVIMP